MNDHTTKVISFDILFLSDQPTATTFTTETPDNTVVQGTTGTLLCSANGYPAPTYTIKRGTTVVNSVGGKYDIPNVQLDQEDFTYSCQPSNNVGSGPIEPLKLTVQVPPSFTTQLPTTKQTKTENETFSYSCTADAKPAAAILWTLKDRI
ncbi:Immunoglobulin C-2 Type [Desmophyllum pertusum]|uniref:Immunoglobulin C-2 Type n=1 Tax=Desmophyllum pertusum TaxID=174260 RepID=A0A9X0DA26_9CNID|nr:Immunoglobulin C-2 Type [Desmophyllum pertusum]